MTVRIAVVLRSGNTTHIVRRGKIPRPRTRQTAEHVTRNGRRGWRGWWRRWRGWRGIARWIRHITRMCRIELAKILSGRKHFVRDPTATIIDRSKHEIDFRPRYVRRIGVIKLRVELNHAIVTLEMHAQRERIACNAAHSRNVVQKINVSRAFVRIPLADQIIRRFFAFIRLGRTRRPTKKRIG